MANFYKCQLGGLQTQWFEEMVNSAENLIIAKDRLKIDPKLVDILVSLKINTIFMKVIRKKIMLG